jgi:branched-chain amino acid transport system substrate-binding protein
MKKGKRMVISMLLLLVLFAGLFGIEGAPKARSSETIKIGLMDTLTTTLAASLPWSHVGYELAVKQINDSGGIHGRMIEIVPKDTGNDPAITVERMNELKAEGVVAIVGPSSDSLAPAAAQWSRQNKMVVITQGTSSTKVSVENANKYFFSSGFNAWQIGKLLAINAVKENNFKSFAFVGTDGAAPNDVRNFFFEEAKKLNPKFKDRGDFRVSTSATEFSTIISAVMAADPDMLVGGIAGPLFISLVQQAELFGMFDMLDYYGWYTTDASNTQGFKENYPAGHTHGIIALPFWFEDAKSKQFVKEWMDMGKELGHGVIYPADLGYGSYKAFLSLAEALKIAKDFSSDSIAEALLKVKVDLPYGAPAYYREFDHMLITDVWYGDTAWSDDWEIPIGVNLIKYGEETYPSEEDFYKYAESKGIDIKERLGLK